MRYTVISVLNWHFFVFFRNGLEDLLVLTISVGGKRIDLVDVFTVVFG